MLTRKLYNSAQFFHMCTIPFYKAIVPFRKLQNEIFHIDVFANSLGNTNSKYNKKLNLESYNIFAVFRNNWKHIIFSSLYNTTQFIFIYRYVFVYVCVRLVIYRSVIDCTLSCSLIFLTISEKIYCEFLLSLLASFREAGK